MTHTAYINVLKESEVAAHDLNLGGVTLLERAINTARGASCVKRVVVRTRDLGTAKLAQSLRVDVDDGALGGTREPHFLVSLHYPFKSAAHFEQLACAGASTVACITRHRHHPVGAFVANKGRMDFSATLDSPDWRGIDERRYFQPLDSLSFHYGQGPGKRAYFVADDIGALGVFSQGDLELANLALERNVFTEAPWAKL
ncbi:MAG: hypothetical protein HUU29_07500 [Planctomycetaceae bacterium]|nr:hypothetical protein [Planctomycetaceae bacterium]